MSGARTPPRKDDVLEALAATFEAGLAPTEALATIARAGPASARLARLLSERLQRGTLAEALAFLKLIRRNEQAVIALGEELGHLPLALRWAIERSRIRRERVRAIAGAVIGPLLFAIFTGLAEQLPALVVGGSSWRSAFGSVLIVIGLAAAALVALPRLPVPPALLGRVRTFAGRVPGIGSLIRLADEATAAALIAAFGDARSLAVAPRAARAVAPQAYAEALTAAAADPLASVAMFSEPFALALAVGVRAGDLPSRFAAFHRRAAAILTARLRATARVLAFAIVFVVALQGVLRLLSTPLPGLGGELGNSPEMRELERELENAGH
jgi:type II secretory pathway component PulF